LESTLARWIADPARRPFFWFVNLLESHSPYLPPRPYGGVSIFERLRAAQDARRYYTRESGWQVLGGTLQVPETVFERMRRLYWGAIRYMDDWLSRVLELLDQAGVLDDTLVIVTADHGDNFGEDGRLSHSLSLDNRLIHVPLVLSGPGAEGRSITSLADLSRLVAEATGLEDHPWQEGPPKGFGVAQVDPPVQMVDDQVIETARRLGVEHALELFATPLTCAVADGLKLLRRGDREELYDLERDPLEQKPRNPDEADRGEDVAALRAALDHPAVASERDKDLSQAAAPAPSPEEQHELAERMKLLGYM
jgi:arylsulfatase A-like enzyme